MYQKYFREIEKLQKRKSEYTWDELEELISEAWEDEKLSSEEHDALMKQLMDTDTE